MNKEEDARALLYDRLAAYRAGWSAGASKKECPEVPGPLQDTFTRGWIAGGEAYNLAMAAERNRLGLPPSKEIALALEAVLKRG